MKKSRKLTTYALGTCLMLAVSAQAVTVDFTSGEGYSDGSLGAHADWNTSGGAIVTNTATTGDVYIDGYETDVYTTNEAAVATYNTFTASMDFRFSDDTNNVAFKSVMNVGVYGSATNSSTAEKILANIRRQGSQKKYSIRIDGTSWDVPLGGSSGTATEADIGLDTVGGDYDTDLLRMTAELTRGSTASNWTINAKLYNLTVDPAAANALIDYTQTEITQTNLFDATDIYGGFGGGQSDSNAGLANRKLEKFAFSATYVAPPAAPAPTIVQWGEEGGDVNIVTNGNQDFQITVTTYASGNECNPVIGTNYYANASTNRSPKFNIASSVTSNTKNVTEDGSGDFIASAKNQPAYRKILTWENFLKDNHSVDSLAVETRRSATVGDDYSYFRWVIEKGTGEWYASDEIPTTAGFALYEENDPANATWYSFNPFQNIDAVTFASTASAISMDDVVTVGMFGSFTNSAASAYCALQTRYFKASAVPGPVSAAMVQWGDVGGISNIVTDTVSFPANTSLTYVEGATSSPPVSVVDPVYYPENTDRTPSFNMAGSFTFKQSIKDGGNGADEIYVTENDAVVEYMTVWENYLDESLSTVLNLSIEFRRGNNTTEINAYRFLVQKASGDWYVSESYTASNKWDVYSVSVDPMTLTWYDFTPFGTGGNAAGVATIGTESSVDMTEISSVGYYHTSTGTGGWQQLSTRYFKAIGIEAAATGYDLWAEVNITSDPNQRGKEDDPDGDNLNNWGEYIFGGEPLDDTNQGTQPMFDAATGDYVFWTLGVEDGLKAKVLTRDSLTIGNWATGSIINVSSGSISGDFFENSENIGTTDPKKFIKLIVE